MTRWIHQTWKGRNIPSPPFQEDWVRSWQELNPTWNYRLWTDADIADFIAKEFEEFFPVWCSYPKAIMRVDAWRYLLLKRLGGLYVDLDFACLQPLDDWLPQDRDRLAIADQGDGWWCNAFMWAPQPELPFFGEIQAALVADSEQPYILEATGPHFLTRYGKPRQDQIHLLPTGRLYPLPYWSTRACRDAEAQPLATLSERFPDAGAITSWANSWHGQLDSTPDLEPDARRVQGKILIVVLRSAGGPEAVSAATETWASDPPSNIEIQFLDCSLAAGTEDPARDPGEPQAVTPQVIFGLEQASDCFSRWLEEKEFEHLLLCEDTTYLSLERLGSICLGDYDLVANEHLASKGLPHLGAGIVLSRKALRDLIADNTLTMPGQGELPIDTILTAACKKFGWRWLATHQFRGEHRRIPCRGNNLISTAGCAPIRMKLIHTLLHEEPVRVASAAHFDWQAELAFYENRLVARSEGTLCGTWDFEDGENLVLNWFDAAEEVFVPLRDDAGDFSGQGLVVTRRAADYIFPKKPAGEMQALEAAARALSQADK